MPQRPMTTLGMPARISMVNPSGREIQLGIRSVRAKAAPMERGTAMTMAMSGGGQGAPDDGPGAELGALQVGHAVGVDGGAVGAGAVGPGAAVEEVPAVDPHGRPRLDGEHGDGEDERRQREHHRDPRRAPPGALLVAAQEVEQPAAVPGRLADRSACGVAGTRPATPPTDAIYLMLRICLIDCACTLVGSGWKSTWDRYDAADALLRVDGPLQHGADVLGRRARTDWSSTRWRTRS